jgi:hypothetical protein
MKYSSAGGMSEWVDISLPGADERFRIFNNPFQRDERSAVLPIVYPSLKFLC